MDNILPILLVAGVAVIGGVAIYLAHLQEKKRRESLAEFASELGWNFDASTDRRHDSDYSHFEVFRRGHSRAALNTLTGSFEVEGRRYSAKAGDFTYKVTTGSGKNRRTTTYHFTYIIIHLPWRTPDLLIRREGLFDKLAGAFGFGDINFESAEFSRRFHVRSPDRKFAYDVIDPRMIEFLLASNPPVVDIELGRCCITDGTRRWQPEEIRQRLSWLHEFFARWPRHVKTDLDGAADRALSSGV